MDDMWTLLGLSAGLLTTVGFIPQIIKGYRTKHMGDVSLFMPILLGIGMFMWFTYGVYLNNMPIIVWNLVALTLNVTMIALILRYRGRGCRQ